MVQENIERLRYYQRQYLGAQDFTDEQSYQRDMRRRHNLAHHLWGIVGGLELSTDDSGSVYVQPGMAIDGYGREIVVFRPYQLTTAFLQDGQYHTVWLQYQEVAVSTVQDGYEACNTEGQDNRVGETFQTIIDPLSTYGTLIVNDSALPSNTGLSIPYQEFPDGLMRWLVPAGKFLWDGKQFTLSTEGRRYIGSVTAEIVAPSTHLLVRAAETLPQSSANAVSAPPLTLTMLVEGELSVRHGLSIQEDMRLQGGMIDFEDEPDKTGGQAISKGDFTLARVQQSRGKDVRVQIGREGKGNNHFVVGADKTDVFTVADSGDGQLTGSLTIAQNLTVTGNIALAGNLALGEVGVLAVDKNTLSGTDIHIQLGKGRQGNNRFVVGTDKTDLLTVADSGDVSISGALKLSNDLSIPGTLTLDEQEQFALTSVPADAADTQRVGGKDLLVQIGTGNIGKNRFVVGTRRGPLLSITDDGHAHMVGSLVVDNDITIAGTLNAQRFNLTGSLNISGLRVSGVTDLEQDLLVKGLITAGGGMTILGPLEAQQNLAVHGSLTANNGLTVLGTLDTQQAVLTTGSIRIEKDMTILGPLEAQQDVSVTGTINVQGNMSVAGALNAGQDLNVVGSARIEKDMTTGGPMTVGQDLHVVGQFNARNGASIGNGLETRGRLMVTPLDPAQQAISVQIGGVRSTRPTSGGDIIYGTPNLWLGAAGTVYLKSGYQAVAMDGAEFFSFQEPVSPGDVVVLSAAGQRCVQLARTVHNTSVVGVVSTNPAFVLGGAASEDDIERVRRSLVPVALLGTVPCKVDADIAPIVRGDLLTTSPTPGHAQKVLDCTQAAGAVLGKAMDTLERGKGLISIVVMLS